MSFARCVYGGCVRTARCNFLELGTYEPGRGLDGHGQAVRTARGSFSILVSHESQRGLVGRARERLVVVS